MTSTRNTESTAALRAGQALYKVADQHGLEIVHHDTGAICLLTIIGDLCVLTSSKRSEFEIFLCSHKGAEEFRFPLFALQEGLGLEPRGITFSDERLDAAVGILEELVSRFVRTAQIEEAVLLQKIDWSYRRTLAQSRRDNREREADRLWSVGSYKEAAQLYEQIERLSPVRQKRLELFRSGKAKSRG
jgi:hypothetical protein